MRFDRIRSRHFNRLDVTLVHKCDHESMGKTFRNNGNETKNSLSTSMFVYAVCSAPRVLGGTKKLRTLFGTRIGKYSFSTRETLSDNQDYDYKALNGLQKRI